MTKDPNKIRARKKRYALRHPGKVKAMKRRYYLKYRGKILAQTKAEYESNPEAWYARVRAWKKQNPEKEKAYQRKWAESHKDQISNRMKRYNSKRYLESPDVFKARAAAHYRNHKDLYKTKRQSVSVHRAVMLRHYANRRNDLIRLGANPEEVGQIVELVFQLKASTETKCYYCGVPLFGNPIHIDHIIPLSKGGAHCVSNLCASCPPCNLSKNDKTVDEWNQWKQNVESKTLVGREA